MAANFPGIQFLVSVHLMTKSWIVGLCACVFIACGSPVGDQDWVVPGQCSLVAPAVAPQRTDILFVIDNSGSMKEEQEEVAERLPNFVAELQQGAGVAQDFQVGVISTGVYLRQGDGTVLQYPSESGKLQPVPGSGERILSSTDPNLVGKFQALIVAQGIAGSGQEVPFEAVQLALSPPLVDSNLALGGNGGFLRDGARLLVVVASDEDDCSESVRPPLVSSAQNGCANQNYLLKPVEDYFDFLQNLKDSTGASKEVLWASLAPVSVETKEARAEMFPNGDLINVGCPTSLGPGIRHRRMAELFNPTLDTLTSICETNYQDMLVNTAKRAKVQQWLAIDAVPDARMLKVEITRANGEKQSCTLGNEGVAYQPGDDPNQAIVTFRNTCLRAADDQKVELKQLCAG
jgi:hypothetical protein